VPCRGLPPRGSPREGEASGAVRVEPAPRRGERRSPPRRVGRRRGRARRRRALSLRYFLWRPEKVPTQQKKNHAVIRPSCKSKERADPATEKCCCPATLNRSGDTLPIPQAARNRNTRKAGRCAVSPSWHAAPHGRPSAVGRGGGVRRYPYTAVAVERRTHKCLKPRPRTAERDAGSSNSGRE
jgi:hypothetical protein